MVTTADESLSNTLQGASSTWVDALAQAASSLHIAASDLQDSWNETDAGGPPVEAPTPDPVKLLRRIQALEFAVEALQQDCGAMVARRQVAAREAAGQLSNLRALLQQEQPTLSSLDMKSSLSTGEVYGLECLVSEECDRFGSQVFGNVDRGGSSSLS